MAELRRITEGLTGKESADIIYENDEYLNNSIIWVKEDLSNISSKIPAIKNGILSSLSNRDINIPGCVIRHFNIDSGGYYPGNFKTIGLEDFYYFKKEEIRNVEFYPRLSTEGVMPKAGQYIKISYYTFNTAYKAPLSNRMSLILFVNNVSSSVVPIRVFISDLGNSSYKVDSFYKIPESTSGITSYWIETILETDGSIPIGTEFYFSGYSIEYSDVEFFINCNETALERALETKKIALKNISYINARSVVKGGSLESNADINFTWPIISPSRDVLPIDNYELNNLGLNNILSVTANAGLNAEPYIWIWPNNGLMNLIVNNLGKGLFLKVTFYIYSYNQTFPLGSYPGNQLGFAVNTSAGAKSSSLLKYEFISSYVRKVHCILPLDWDSSATFNYAFAAGVLRGTENITGVKLGQYGITGLAMTLLENRDYYSSIDIEGDWAVSAVKPSEMRVKKLIEENLNTGIYNNLPHNLSCISEFLRKYQLKEVDRFNQLSITCVGDSIFGRVDKSSWTPSNPEISLTPDQNNPDETRLGYETGHFPPNMWQQTVPYKLLEMLQYPHSKDDVKYFNQVSPEISKSGNWQNTYPNNGDNIMICKTNLQNASIQLSFSNAKYCKWIYSCYGASSMGRKVKVSISDDDGISWKSPEDLQLVESISSSSEGSGIYNLPEHPYKFGNIIWSGFNINNSYIIRMENMEMGELGVWGFETWNLPRINVIVTAEGGNTAGSQISRWERFYSVMYNPSLIIYELPYLNDLGVGRIPSFRGLISPTSIAPSSPMEGDFYHCQSDGIYINFDNIKAYYGDYLEWNGSNWELGSSQLENQLFLYNRDNNNVLNRLSMIGCPVLTIVTHNSDSFRGRRYCWKDGLTILRNIVSYYGFASIDLNYYQQLNNIYDIFSDGTHLNDKGVSLYISLLSELLNIPYEDRFVGSTPMQYRPLISYASTGGNIKYGFEFYKIPKVRIFSNSGYSLSNITQSGFDCEKDGYFEFEVYV